MRITRIFINLLCWGYLLVIVGLIAAIRIGGDRIWPCTILIFAPRWPVLVPLPLLILPAIFLHRRMLKVLLIASILAIFPLMGFCLALCRLKPIATGGLPIRVIAFNVHHNNLSNPAVAPFLANMHADVVAMEEMHPLYNQSLFPPDIWHIHQEDEIFLASRFPIISATNIYLEGATRFELQTPAGIVDVIVVHLSSPHFALQDTVSGDAQGPKDLEKNIRERAQESSHLSQLIRSKHPLIIAGDFNLAFDSQLFSGFFGSLSDSFQTTGFGFGWTYLNQWTSVRIDHVLSNDAFDRTACFLGPYLGSPHRPVVADLMLHKS